MDKQSWIKYATPRVKAFLDYALKKYGRKELFKHLWRTDFCCKDTRPFMISVLRYNKKLKLKFYVKIVASFKDGKNSILVHFWLDDRGELWPSQSEFTRCSFTKLKAEGAFSKDEYTFLAGKRHYREKYHELNDDIQVTSLKTGRTIFYGNINAFSNDRRFKNVTQEDYDVQWADKGRQDDPWDELD